jgi:Protein of unknown function (DUF2723)
MITEQEECRRTDHFRQASRRCPAAWGPLLCLSHRLMAGLAGLAAFIVYLRTLAPSIVWGDSPELTAAAFTAGVPHPTGYPLYMLLAHAFLRACPWGGIAYRMNLLAALSGAAAVSLIYRLLAQVTRSRCASLAGALLFAFGCTFWSQAVIAEHYPFELLCMAAVLGSVLAWDRRGGRRWLLASAVIYGLCLAHHLMSLLLAPGLLYFVLTSRHRSQFLRELRWTLPLFLLPLTLYLYLPLAALRDPPMNWGDPRTWDRFIAHVTGSQYHGQMFQLTRAQYAAQVQLYVHSLPAQFSPAFLWLAPLGAWSLARRRRRTLLIYLADVIYALNYFVYNVEIYYLPSHLMVALWIACGLRQTGAWLSLGWRRAALLPARRTSVNAVISAAALLLLAITPLAGNWRLDDRHDDSSALVYARAALATLEPNAVVLADGDTYYFPLLYPRFVERLRPDVTLIQLADVMIPSHLRLLTRHRAEGLKVTVPPRRLRADGRQPDNRLLKQLIADNLDRRPIYLLCPPDSLQAAWLTDAIGPYCQVMDTNTGCLRLTRRPPGLMASDPLPQRPVHIAFGPLRPRGAGDGDRGGLSGNSPFFPHACLELLGYEVHPLRQDRLPLLRITYYWRLNDLAAARRARVWVLFTDAGGSYRCQKDGTPEFHNNHPLAYGLGERSVSLPHVLRETFTLYVPPEDWNQRLHVRLAVALNGRFLPARSHASPWVDIGELPASAPEDPSSELAALASP